MEFHKADRLDEIPKILADLEMRNIPEYVVSRFNREDLLVQFFYPTIGVFDFCHTIGHSQFEQIRGEMSEWSRTVETAMLKAYETEIPLATPKQKADFEEGWIVSGTYSLAEDGFTTETFQRIANRIVLRDHAEELLCLFDRRIVVSAGYRELVSSCLQRHHLGANIISNVLRFKDNQLVGIELDRLVTGSTKGTLLQSYLTEFCLYPNALLVVGDDMNVDGSMMFEQSVNVLVRRANNVMRLETLNENNWGRLSCITSSLKPIVQLLREARS